MANTLWILKSSQSYFEWWFWLISIFKGGRIQIIFYITAIFTIIITTSKIPSYFKWGPRNLHHHHNNLRHSDCNSLFETYNDAIVKLEIIVVKLVVNVLFLIYKSCLSIFIPFYLNQLWISDQLIEFLGKTNNLKFISS